MLLIEAAQQFPTVVFTIGLGICLIYWLFVLLGALDIDLFGDASGAGKAVGDVAGAGKAIGDHDVDLEVETGSIWSGLGLTRVPITISISVLFLVCWCISLMAMHYLPDVLGTASWVAAVVLPVTLIVGLPITGLLVRPLGGVFELKEGKSNRDYVGHTVTVTTGNVDDGFGQGMVEDGGTVLVIPIRCDKAGLSRNDKALIIDFDTERQAYVVEPVTDMLVASRGDVGQSA
jgi:hypothetical protein